MPTNGNQSQGGGREPYSVIQPIAERGEAARSASHGPWAARRGGGALVGWMTRRAWIGYRLTEMGNLGQGGCCGSERIRAVPFGEPPVQARGEWR
jgi:hypothetical protein